MGALVSLETKEMALKLFRQGFRARKISETLNLDRSHVKEWQYLFDGGDTRWVSDKPVRRADSISQTQKAFIVNAYKMDAFTMAELCKGFLLSKTVIKCWVRSGDCQHDRRTETNQGASKGTEGVARQEQVLGNLYKDLEGRGDRSSKKKILRAFAAGQEAGLSVSLMLKELKIPRTDYYRWLKNPDGKDESGLIHRIAEIQNANKFNIGSKRMAQMLKQQGIAVNHKKVERLMTENNLHAKQKIRKHPKDYYRAKAQKAKGLPQNVLNRDFTASEPNKKLLTDITYIRIKDGAWCFLSAVKDVFNKEIVAAAMSARLDEQLVLDTIAQLKKNVGSLKGSLIHSDRGWTYTNPRFVNLLKKEGAVQSLSRKGDCWDNAPMESFFSSFKSETIHRDSAYYSNLSYAEMVKVVQDYIYEYNHERISKGLNWMSPVQYRTKFVLN